MSDYQWPIVLDRVELAKQGSPAPLAAYRLFVVQHVLDDLPVLIAAFIELGCDPSAIDVIGIPYSSRPEAGAQIEKLGCSVTLPAFFPFDGVVQVKLNESLRAKDGKKIIILEDGAYAVPLLAQLSWMKAEGVDKVIGAVEQTTRGERVDKQLERLYRLTIPVISVPPCQTKKHIEPPYIALAVQVNLSSLLTHVGAVAGLEEVQRVGVLGLGSIGTRIAAAFKARGRTVYATDLSPDRKFEAEQKKFLKLDSESIPQCDLLVGTTGNISIGAQAIQLVKHNAILASSSSRQIEIDVETLFQLSSSTTLVGPSAPCVLPLSAGRMFDMPIKGGSKRIVLLYDGYPINFFGTSLPDHVSDAVMSLLLEGVLALAQPVPGFPVVGVYPGSQVLIDADFEIYNRFLQCKPDDGFQPEDFA